MAPTHTPLHPSAEGDSILVNPDTPEGLPYVSYGTLIAALHCAVASQSSCGSSSVLLHVACDGTAWAPRATESPPSPPPQIAYVRGVQDGTGSDGEAVLAVVWYYRPEEAIGGRKV